MGQRKLVCRGTSEANAPRESEFCLGKLAVEFLPGFHSLPEAQLHLLWSQPDTVLSEHLSLSCSSCFINATKRVLFHTISEKEPDPGSSKSQFQALSVSHTFLDCRKGLVLAYYPFLCHHVLLGALPANLVLQCLPHQFFMPQFQTQLFLHSG